MITKADLDHLLSDEFQYDESLLLLSTVGRAVRCLQVHPYVQELRSKFEGTEQERDVVDRFFCESPEGNWSLMRVALMAIAVAVADHPSKAAFEILDGIAFLGLYARYSLAGMVAEAVMTTQQLYDKSMIVCLDENGVPLADVNIRSRVVEAIQERKLLHVSNEASIMVMRAELRKIPIADRPRVRWIFYSKEVHFDDNLKSNDAWNDPRTQLVEECLEQLL